MKYLTIQNLIQDLKENWKRLLLLFLLLWLAFTFLAYLLFPAVPAHSAKTAQEMSVKLKQERRETIATEENYSLNNLLIQEYQKAIENSEAQVTSLQQYIDTSVLMKLDPEAVVSLTANYQLAGPEGADPGKIGQALLTFITSGQIYDQMTCEDRKYLYEVVSASANKDKLSLTLKYYDEAKAQEILKEIEGCLIAKTESLKGHYGEYSLETIEQKTEILQDEKLAKNQTNVRTSLENAQKTRDSLVTKLQTAEENRDLNASYEVAAAETEVIEDPDAGRNKKKELILSILTGFGYAVLILLGAAVVKYSLNDRIYQVEDLLEVIDKTDTTFPAPAVCKKGIWHPEAERVAMDLRQRVGLHEADKKLLLLTAGEATLYLENLSEAFQKEGFEPHTTDFSQLQENDQITQYRHAVLICRERVSKAIDLKIAIAVCSRYGIRKEGSVYIS